ncbi:MAG: MFS transporter [Hyphomicrobiales bacterium]|nr:MFS transporter [Hyphomicrobiales bacterium]
MRQIDVHKLADDAEFNGFHGLVLFWCALIIIFDGYDLAIAGIALPSIMDDMGVDPTSAGFMVSSALFGMLFGAILMGTLADRIGRVNSIAICVAMFSLGTASAGLTDSPVVFSILRFIAGLGIGGVMPNVVAEMTEYAPRRIRATMVTLMFSGYAIGGLLATLLGKGLLADYGWQSVFFAAGLPVLLIPVIMRALPESMPFLLMRGRTDDLKRVVARFEPRYIPQPTDQFAVPDKDKADKATISHLFHEGRAFSTVMYWVTFFMCLFMVYAVGSWLAKLMVNAGFPLGSSLNMVLALYFGGMIGAVGGGWLADKLHIKWVLAGMFVLAAVSITLVGYGDRMPTPLLLLIVGFVGASTIGTQIVAYAYTGQFYPMAIRSTGIGWASGAGRSGGIVAPVVIGGLVAVQLSLQQNFMAMAVPAVIAFVAVCLINHKLSASAQKEDVSAELPETFTPRVGAAVD